MGSNYSWDARTYDKVSANVQLELGRKLLDRRVWAGNEIVMDAGAGSGNLTRVLAEKVPNGHVYAVDADSNMVRQAKTNLSEYGNVEVIHSSMQEVRLPTAVDVIFSNAALHWVLDQEGIFSHFWQLLKPSGELLIEYGGHGNLEGIIPSIFKMMDSDRFKEHFARWKQSWYFPKADETESRLRNSGFRNINVNISRQTMNYPDRDSFADFVRTVIMKPFFGYLPDDATRNGFLGALLSEIEQRGGGWSLDYVRIGVSARK